LVLDERGHAVSMTIEQVMENLVSHNACAAGIAWAIGKDSDAIWASTDEFAPQYLLWWAIQNAGQPGWHSAANVLSTLSTLTGLCCKYNTVMVVSLHHEFAQVNKNNLAQSGPSLYSKMEHDVQWEARNPQALVTFRQKTLAIIYEELKPTL
jgi:hypothetical protein